MEAPVTPISKVNINSGSKITFRTAPAMMTIEEIFTEDSILAALARFCDNRVAMAEINIQNTYSCACGSIVVHSIYLYDDYFTLIINASRKPLSIENILLDEIESSFSGDTETYEDCSLITDSVPPLG